MEGVIHCPVGPILKVKSLVERIFELFFIQGLHMSQ